MKSLWRSSLRGTSCGRMRITRCFATYTSSTPSSRSTQEVNRETQDSLEHVVGYAHAHIALRDACKCSRCVDQSTMQREFSFADIPDDIQGHAKQDANGNWKVQWSKDIPGFEDHISTYTPTQIERFKSLPKHHHKSSVMLWDKEVFEKETSSVNYHEFMNDKAGLAKVLYLFARHGLVFIKNIPRDPESATKMAERIAPLRNTFYGTSWNVKSLPQAKNVAYTSKYLGFHMDLLYMKESPTFQLLHCLDNSCTGGESRFVDTLKAYDVLCHEDDRLAEALRKTKLRYEYDNDGQYYTDVKPVIQMKTSPFFPHREIKGSTNEDVKNVSRVFWSPPFIGSVWSELGESTDLTKAKVEASAAFAKILERPELVYEEKMEPGTAAIFDNLRVLHARNAFDMNSGERWLKGCYLDGQDVLSREIGLSDEIKRLDEQM